LESFAEQQEGEMPPYEYLCLHGNLKFELLHHLSQSKEMAFVPMVITTPSQCSPLLFPSQKAMKKYDLEAKDFAKVVFSAPDARNHAPME